MYQFFIVIIAPIGTAYIVNIGLVSSALRFKGYSYLEV